MKKIKKRGAVYGVIALLLCTAAYLNWNYVEPPADLLETGQTKPDAAAETAGESTAGDSDSGKGAGRGGEHAQGDFGKRGRGRTGESGRRGSDFGPRGELRAGGEHRKPHPRKGL